MGVLTEMVSRFGWECRVVICAGVMVWCLRGFLLVLVVLGEGVLLVIQCLRSQISVPSCPFGCLPEATTMWVLVVVILAGRR
eukprot:15448362-Alexandrium_andersonii.AAC.1